LFRGKVARITSYKDEAKGKDPALSKRSGEELKGEGLIDINEFEGSQKREYAGNASPKRKKKING